MADVAGYSRLMGEDDAATLATLTTHRELFDEAVTQQGGRIVNAAGDSILAEFGSAVTAVQCAIDVQRRLAEANGSLAEMRRLEFRVGVHVGDVLVSDGDLYGDGVNIAARLQVLARPGGICVSGPVYDYVRKAVPVAFADLGLKRVKNIDELVRVFALETASGTAASYSAAADAPAAGAKPSIVVLPFDNMSGDLEQTYFSDGITEDIITDLSKISGLFVIARNSAFTYKGRAVKVQEISRELGVRYVLEGGVRKSGSRVRITAQLIDAHTGGHIWADRYDRELTEIFAVQDEVTKKIVDALSLKLSAPERQRVEHRGTGVIDAYDFLLRGRQQMQLFTRATNAEARLMFERAAELDPRFASAFAGIARTHMFDYVNSWSDSADASLRKAYSQAGKAVALDPDNPEAHNVLAGVLHWMKDLDGAIAANERALALDQNFAHAYASLGSAFYYAGQPERSLSFLDQAIRLDPRHPDQFLHFLGLTYFALGRLDDAIAVLNRRLIRNPNTDISRILLASIYGHLGQHEKARQHWDQAMAFNPRYSLEQRRRILPYRDPAEFDRIVDGLRKAGLLPE
jgi:TolB-like protein/Tfp pilus assembly protein PilF